MPAAGFLKCDIQIAQPPVYITISQRMSRVDLSDVVASLFSQHPVLY